mmetsp:Transcript_17539/g.38441  ORF Transcript_17539/g.38441 Transcript_17539/m.38441 type:complete len:205 (+) Transcript_17539:1453-2067(+)
MRSRRAGSMSRHGAISTTFCFRSCREQSRSNRWMQRFPSPTTWTSICAARSKKRSMKTSARPKLMSASLLQRWKASAKSSGLRTTAWPLPPPPKEALSRSGNSMGCCVRKASASWVVVMAGLPCRTRSPTSAACCFAFVLSPKRSMICELGPTNLTPSFSHIAANSAFSARKPYPGCTASHFCSRAILRMASASMYGATGFAPG